MSLCLASIFFGEKGKMGEGQQMSTLVNQEGRQKTAKNLSTQFFKDPNQIKSEVSLTFNLTSLTEKIMCDTRHL